MSRQIRVDDDAYEFLERLSAKHGKPISDCASQVFDVFASFVDEVENDGRVVIETAEGRLLPMSALLRPSRQKRSLGRRLRRIETVDELRALLDEDDDARGVSRP